MSLALAKLAWQPGARSSLADAGWVRRPSCSLYRRLLTHTSSTDKLGVLEPKLAGHDDPDRLRSRLSSITELAQELGVTVRAIRFYETRGLLEPQRAGSMRVYTYRDRARLQIILRGKRLGFSLARVREYLDLYDADPTHRVQLEHLLRGARQRIAELESQREDLELTLEELREMERLTLDALRRLNVEPPAPSGGSRSPAREGRGPARSAQAKRGSRSLKP
ncbi:MAG TPA: MerR family DNA-binding transcriptional regulator [Thermoanaerobaculia bacterium]|nr:MerR family DNA-binding transcriptional regulator [Thermoanaerobaculia bacterium]